MSVSVLKAAVGGVMGLLLGVLGAQAASAQVLTAASLVATEKGNCGPRDGKLVPADFRRGKVVFLADVIKRTKRTLKNADGARAGALQRKLIKLKRQIRIRQKSCKKGVVPAAATPTVAPATPTPSNQFERTENGITVKLAEAYFEPVSGSLVVWFEALNRNPRAGYFRVRESTLTDTAGISASNTAFITSSVDGEVLSINGRSFYDVDTPLETPVTFGILFPSTTRPSGLSNLLLNSDKDLQFSNISLSDAPLRRVVPFTRFDIGVRYTLKAITYDAATTTLLVGYQLLNNASPSVTHARLRASTLTDQSQTNATATGVVLSDGTFVDFSKKSFADQDTLLGTPVSVTYTFRLASPPTSIANLLTNGDSDLQLKNIPVPFVQ